VQEIKYLTEKDMEYFYKLEEQGEAVIIRLEPEQLLSLDLSELDRRKMDEGSEISEEEIRQWLQQHSSELRQRYEENEAVLQENRQLRDALGENEKNKCRHKPSGNCFRQECAARWRWEADFGQTAAGSKAE